MVVNELELSYFVKRYLDTNSAPAYDQSILLKVVLFAYFRGIATSRKIEQACRENVVLWRSLLVARHTTV